MNNESYITNRPFEATNKKPYIFISYKHEDWREVYPIIGRFNDEGYNIWYDAALTKGQNYDIEIANKIKNSDLFITFLSERVMEKANDQEDYLVKELSVAIQKKRPRLFIYLESVGPDDLDGYYLMNCNGIQSIFKNPYGDDEEMFISECLTSFKYHFKIEPNEVEEDSPDEEFEIDETQDVEVTSSPSMSRMDVLCEAVNSLSDTYLSNEDAVYKIVENVYELYEDNARRYLADAYGFEPEHAHADSEFLYAKYGTSGNSFDDRLSNLKLEKPKMRTEVINRIKGLNSIGYEIADENDERKAVTEFSASEEIELAKYNHYVWCRDRIGNNKEYGYEGAGAEYLTGVVFGSIRSDIDVISPYRDSLLLWDDLSNYEQEENIDFINRIFRYLPSDLKIVKLNIVRGKSHLKGLINGGVKEIALDCDIVFDEDDRNDIKIFDDDLIIDGNGHTIDADRKSRIFTIRGKNITFKNLTFKNGLTDRNGGAVFIHQRGSCSFSDCYFINNLSNGGILKVTTEGGAIYNEGSCSLDACVFKKNNICGEHSKSKDIAPFESFKLNDCTFDEKSEDASQQSKQIKSDDGLENTDLGNASLEGEVKNHDGKGDVVGLEYSFRNPGSGIYDLGEKYFHVTRGNPSLDFSKLSDEDYARVELNIIRAICIVKAAGGVIIPSNKCKEAIDFNKLRHFKTIDEGLKLYVSKMRELGWKDGIYNFKNKTCPLSFSGWAGDKEEEISIRILNDIEKAGYSFCKLENGADIPVLQVADKTSDEKQTGKFDFERKSLPEPYEGNEAYVFISYNHSDSKIVFHLIKQLSDAGFNVWYDRGVNLEADYDSQILNHIKNAALFVSMLSENMMNSSHEDDFAVKELAAAISLKVPCLPIYLEDVSLDGFYLLNYVGKQSIFKQKYDDENMFIESCISAFKSFGVEPKREIPFSLPDHNFKYLENLIGDNNEIVLKSDIVFNDSGYENGIEINDNIVIDGGGHTIDACGKARIFNISAANVVLKNINFINGFAQSGGALFVKHSAGLDIYSCKFKNNHAEEDGGAILNNGKAKILDSLFSSNDSKGFGGAIENAGIADMDIENCEFNANEGVDGVAVTNYSRINISNTKFYKNEAVDSAGAVANFKDCSIRGCDFLNNRSKSTIIGNGGGAIFNYNGELELLDSLFEDNHSNLSGGAVCNFEGYLRIDNSDFRKNTSNDKGNSIFNSEKSSIVINKSRFDEIQSNAIFSQGKMELKDNCKFKKDIMQFKKDVFISYSTMDAQIAENICSSIESKGSSCWIAPRDIVAGGDFNSQIINGIENAEVFLVIYSQNYAKSHFAKMELDHAFQNSKQILSVNIDGSDVEGDFNFLLGNAQWINESTNINEGIENFKKISKPNSEPKKKGLRSRLFGRR